MPEFGIYRASEAEIDQALTIVEEYYEAARVIVREDSDAFRKQYFADGAAVWLAVADGKPVGCVALRRLNGTAEPAEINVCTCDPPIAEKELRTC